VLPGPSVMCAICLDVIQSRSRHDFVRCKCKAIAIDGGSDYVKCVGNPENFIWDFEEEQK
jgi:hypothetical protein